MLEDKAAYKTVDRPADCHRIKVGEGSVNGEGPFFECDLRYFVKQCVKFYRIPVAVRAYGILRRSLSAVDADHCPQPQILRGGADQDMGVFL